MSLKVIAGILMIIVGLGTGVIEWAKGGFAGNYPAAGLALTALGMYLIVDEVRKKPKPRSVQVPVSGEALGIIGLLTAVIAGTIAVEEFKKRQRSLRDEDILSLERQLESLRAQGKVPPDKYLELRAAIDSLKQQRGLR